MTAGKAADGVPFAVVTLESNTTDSSLTQSRAGKLLVPTCMSDDGAQVHGESFVSTMGRCIVGPRWFGAGSVAMPDGLPPAESRDHPT